MLDTEIATPLGNTVDGDRVRFRVWAPFAERVAVSIGETVMSMQSLDDGTWVGEAPGGPGLEYRYLIEFEGQTVERIDPRARHVTNSVGASIVDDRSFPWSDNEHRFRTIDELVVYELHPATFAGDLDGVAERLEYLADSGFTAIELMPVAEFAGDVSWGYNPALPYAVESAYGGPSALKRLVDRAHGLGIAVILDVVYNHFGPSDLDLWRFDGWSEHDGGGIYFYQDHRSETPWGHTRPDYGRPEVRSFILDNARMWFEEYHLDGLRLDSTVNMRTVGGVDGSGDIPEGWSLMQALAEMCDAEYPGRILIAEDLQRNAWLTMPVSDGGAGFDLQWDAGFVHPVRASLSSIDDGARDLPGLVEAVTGDGHRDGWDRVVYTESHDEVANGSTRVVSEIDFDEPEAWYARGRAMIGMVLVLTARGVPMMFQGQEWLESEYFRDDTPIDWDAARGALADLADLRRLIRLRSGRAVGALGLRGSGFDLAHLDEGLGVFAYRRWRNGGPGDEVMVAVNLSSPHRTLHLAGPAQGCWELAVTTDHDTADVIASDSGAIDVDMAGYSAMVFLAR